MHLAKPTTVVYAILLLAAGKCHAQTSTRLAQTSKLDICQTLARTNHPYANEEIVHKVLMNIPPENRAKLTANDTAILLLCGSSQQSEDFFRDIAGKTSVRITATVIEAGEHMVRVATDETSAFRFYCEEPLKSLPPIGSTVIVSGIYASYNREEASITIKNSVVAPFIVLVH
jgi:hypothetical protein